MENKQTLIDSIFKIGEVVSVRGRNVEIKVDKEKNTSHLLFKGELIRNTSVGGLIKIVKGFTKIVGRVEGEYIDEEKYYTKKEYASEKEKICRILNISMLGYFGINGFVRGIKEMPLLGNECFLLEKIEFEKVHNFVNANDEPITLGTLSLEKGQEIRVGINSLFSSHIGIFGNTGSGKSYTLAKIYRELFLKYQNNNSFKKNGTFLLFDFSGEYSGEKSIIEGKKIYDLTTKKKYEDIKDCEKFPLNENDLTDIDLISILADATEKTQKPFISRSIEFYRKVEATENSLEYFKNIIKKRIKEVLRMTDKEKAFILFDYLKIILETPESNINEDFFTTAEWNNKFGYFMPKGLSPCRELNDQEILDNVLYKSAENYQFPIDILSKIIHFMYLQIIFDIYNDRAQNEHISPAINKLKSKCNDIRKVLNTNCTNIDIFVESNFVIINLNDVNLIMKKTLPLLLSKKAYSDHKNKQSHDENKFLNIIIDEAHNILSETSFREAENWKDYRLETFEEIIKEGRKFGVFLTISSQRPYDISPTIISQLHNYFIHRLINNLDIIAVEKTIAYLDKLSVEYLSILPTGTCVLAGLLVQVPVVIDIGRITPFEYEPNNKTIDLVNSWKD